MSTTLRQPRATGTLATRPLSPRLREVLDHARRHVEDGLVPLVLFNDPEIYGAELDRVFARCWIFVAHESEIANPGDYLQRAIGEDPWIVTRDAAGKIHVLFDSCIHHGAQICRGEKGNTTYFECPYHGWTYDTAGHLVAVPQKNRAYKGLATEKLGLHQAAHVDVYRGLIFANLDPEAEPLRDHLGDFRWYLDLHLGLGGGMEVIGEPNRWRVDADWKTAAENFCGDSYHTQTLHRSIGELNLIPKGGVGTGGTFDVHITDISGHATSMRRTGPGTNTLFGYPEELKRQLTMPDLSEGQREVARGSLLHTGTVFPNLSLIHLPAIDSPNRESVSYLGLRQWQPKGPGRMEAVSWVLVPKAASADYRMRAYKASAASFGPSGNFEQDDTIVWSSVARAAKSVLARRGVAMLNFQMGMPGMSEAALLPDWPGPGTAWNTNLEEGVQRTFFRHWLQSMGAE